MFRFLTLAIVAIALPGGLFIPLVVVWKNRRWREKKNIDLIDNKHKNWYI